ncbi:uncharacterized protein LOC122202342 isoform X4 [Panthera leo]|uniref:uncharacterized protein LOC122202342 isoform X4 n=1 Tax=Panthera leo TaxID=9689 RepID=UPI001C69AA9B|nr:uncharacterized protein LOC122202342 isoform X4 [Panthera leo]
MERWIKGFWKGRKPRSALRDKETPSREQEMISVRVNSTLMKQLLCARYGGERKVEKTDPAFKGFSHQCWYCNPSLSLLIAAQYSILDSNTCDFHSPNGYQGYPYLSAIIILVHGLLWTYVQFLGNICLKMRFHFLGERFPDHPSTPDYLCKYHVFDFLDPLTMVVNHVFMEMVA